MKIVASDYDGTLCRNGVISAEEKEAIARWRESGKLFGIVTGRAYPSIMRAVIETKPEYDFIVSNNGALIHDGSGHLLSEIRNDKRFIAPISEICAAAGALKLEIMREDRDLRFIIDRIPGESAVLNSAIMGETAYFTQLSARMETVEEALALAAAVNERFCGSLSAYAAAPNVDVVARGVSKASGLRRYAEIYGVNEKDIVTVGDNYNDLPMINEFGGFIMASAAEGVRVLAGKTCESLCEILKL